MYSSATGYQTSKYTFNQPFDWSSYVTLNNAVLNNAFLIGNVLVVSADFTDTDGTVTLKPQSVLNIIDVTVISRKNEANATMQIKNNTRDITDALDISSINTVTRATTIDIDNANIEKDGSLVFVADGANGKFIAYVNIATLNIT